MTTIFVSYRRDDSMGWASHLFSDLSRHLGKDQVFMDINGGIPRGANFETVLTDAVGSCSALLALIGPTWLEIKRSDGRRRLEFEDDWVRKEISTGLQRGIPVVPVLFYGTRLPETSTLPSELQSLSRQQEARLDDAQWNHDFHLLVGDLIRQVPGLRLLRPLESDDVASAGSGIEVLRQLIAGDQSVAGAVGRSKEVVENTYQRAGRLDILKTVHNALHDIEFDCLRPLQASGAVVRMRPFRARFKAEADLVRAALVGFDIDSGLRDDIDDGLDATQAAFEVAVNQLSEASFARLLGELNALLSGLTPRLDLGISDAARELNLNRLVELMSSVRAMVESRPGISAPQTFVQGIDALLRLRVELSQRTQEHTQLQRLDSKLRAVCVGGVAKGLLGGEWNRICLVRARLAGPLSAELQAAASDMTALEQEIDVHLARGEETAAFDAVQEYFRVVADAFRNVDRALKGFCLRLSAVSQPLKTVLDLL